jgi:hypothetical protein
MAPRFAARYLEKFVEFQHPTFAAQITLREKFQLLFDTSPHEHKYLATLVEYRLDGYKKERII